MRRGKLVFSLTWSFVALAVDRPADAAPKAVGSASAGVSRIADPLRPPNPPSATPPADGVSLSAESTTATPHVLTPPAKEPEAAPPLAESQIGYDNGLFVRSQDKLYSLYINGFAQARYALTVNSGQVVDNGFAVPLGRLALSGNLLSPKLKYFFQLEGSTLGNNNSVTMLDWWMKYTFSPYLSVLAGRWIVPYSRQFLTHPGTLLFAGLSPADSAFNLPRAIGVQIGGTAGRISYDAFLTNSVRPLDVGTQANRADSISGGGRLELAILKPYGYLETAPTPPPDTQLSVGVAVAYNPVADPSILQNVEAGDDTLNLTADLGFRLKRLSVQGAFYYRHLLNRDVADSYGYYGQVGFYVVRERIELAARTSGALLSSRDKMVGLQNVAPGSTTEYSGGVNLYLFSHGAKLQTDYSYVQNNRFGSALFPAENIGVHRFRIQTQVLF